MESGLIISLDFESYYGISSGYDYSSNNIEYYSQIPNVVQRLLALFEQYEISATWATVGLLGLESKDEFESFAPKIRPTKGYLFPDNHKRFMDNISSENYSSWLSFPDLIRLIDKSENQEIGSHTFMHSFFNEIGVSHEMVKADIMAHKRFFKEKFDIEMDSLIFPHDQFPQDFDLKELGFENIRLPFHHKAYASHRLDVYSSIFNKIYRFLDRYNNLSGSKGFKSSVDNDRMMKIPQSRFLSFNNFSFLRQKALKNVKTEMSIAAKDGLFYHLWWHPHNMCADIDSSFHYLQSVFEHYIHLRDEYDWRSYNFRGYNNNVKSAT